MWVFTETGFVSAVRKKIDLRSIPSGQETGSLLSIWLALQRRR